jgi:hypothetical protein
MHHSLGEEKEEYHTPISNKAEKYRILINFETYCCKKCNHTRRVKETIGTLTWPRLFVHTQTQIEYNANFSSNSGSQQPSAESGNGDAWSYESSKKKEPSYLLPKAS